jgi:hypothetical protein
MWSALSNLGDAALTLPLAIACAAWLTTSLAGWRSSTSWLTLLAAGASMVGVTKILYAGCGIQIRAIDFRVISGHTMLASAVWPMALILCLPRRVNAQPRLALALGLALAAGIGTARVFDDAHTVSEVIAGWGVGSLVTVLFARATRAVSAARHCVAARHLYACLRTSRADPGGDRHVLPLFVRPRQLATS